MSKDDETQRQQLAARALHHRASQLHPGEALAPPLISSSVFHLPDGIEATDTYGRMNNPTWRDTESLLELIEQAPCVLFPSGMAAIAALFYSQLKSGDTLLLPSDGYYTSRLLAEGFLQPMGVQVRCVPTRELAEADLNGVTLAFAETPSNPGLDVLDLQVLAERVHAAGARLAVDNTTSTAFLQRPLALGADVVVCSDTKAAGGHSDLLLGHVASRDAALIEAVRRWRLYSGAIPGPFEAWLLHRGLETLELRLCRMCHTTSQLAPQILAHRITTDVRFPGLHEPAHASLVKRQMLEPGYLISFTLADAATAERFVNHCPLLATTTSFGGVHSAAERRARWGEKVAAGFVRLAVGCEPTETLIASVMASLDAMGQ